MGKTKYVVLEETEGIDPNDVVWQLYAENVEATSSTGALRISLKGQGNLGNRYVAIPRRSWKPQPVEVETQHHLKIG